MCFRCCRTHQGMCSDGKICCIKFGKEGHFIKKFPKNRHGRRNPGNRAQSLAVIPLDKGSPRETTPDTGRGTTCLYGKVTKRKELSRCCHRYDQSMCFLCLCLLRPRSKFIFCNSFMIFSDCFRELLIFQILT